VFSSLEPGPRSAANDRPAIAAPARQPGRRPDDLLKFPDFPEQKLPASHYPARHCRHSQFTQKEYARPDSQGDTF
jgi:hypothetical protein